MVGTTTGMRRAALASGTVIAALLASPAPGGVMPAVPAALQSVTAVAPGVPTCLGEPTTMFGTDGPDVLTGTDGPDVISAGPGHDVVRGGGGDDRICGGPGNDFLRGGSGADALAGGYGRDSLFGGPDDDTLAGDVGADGCLQGAGLGTKDSCAVRVAGAGDVACDPGSGAFRGTARECRMRQTARLLEHAGFVAVLTLGDNQYEDGALWKFRRSYRPSWGRVRAITHPAVGNHEYNRPGARGYFDYFGKAAGRPSRGYYGFDLDEWHVVVLNSTCAAVGGCGRGSAQLRWLREDLARHPASCTLAYWHQPRFSSGIHGSDAAYAPFWKALYRAGAEVVLNGHDHIYERFAPQRPDGTRDRGAGIREFVVGTGGRSLYRIERVRANSVARNASTFGVLTLTLLPEGYEWRFVPESSTGFSDSGSASCH